MQESTNKKLTSGQKRLVSWLATPKRLREPKNLEELAEEIGVNQSTVWHWRRKLNLDALAAEEARMRLFEHLPKVYETLATKAEGGSPEHIELFFRIANGHRQKIDLPLEDRRSLLAEFTNG